MMRRPWRVTAIPVRSLQTISPLQSRTVRERLVIPELGTHAARTVERKLSTADFK